jgi:hypothetical protein
MSFSFTINSAQDWLSSIPSLLLSEEKSSGLVSNKDAQEYMASTLIEYFQDSQESFINSIISILESNSDSGKYIMVQVLLQSEVLWNDLVQSIRLKTALSTLALSLDKAYTQDAAYLSNKLMDLSFYSSRQEILKEEDSPPETDEAAVLSSLQPSKEEIPLPEEVEMETVKEKERDFAPLAVRSAPEPAVEIISSPEKMEIGIEKEKESAPSAARSPPKPAKAGPSIPKAAPPSPPLPPPPSVGAIADAEKIEPFEEDQDAEIEEEIEELLEEPTPVEESFDEDIGEPLDEITVVSKKKKSISIADDLKREKIMDRSLEEFKEDQLEKPQPISEPESVYTHVHYFNRMNTRKTYPFTVSLSKVEKKVRKRAMHVLTGERETETQAEFELDHLTRQIMVELLISGCLVQPNFQYVDPEKLPVELTFYITPLVEAGYQSSKVDGQLVLKSDVGVVLQKLPLSDIHIVSTRIAKIAALIGTLGGMAVPVLDFFGWGIQDALTGQLSESIPGITSNIDVRSLISTSQILILILFLGFALIWWFWKGRSKRAPKERLSLNLPQFK